MGTHGGGCRKNRKGSGHRGGVGMAGSGKRADHKKTLVLKLYGNNYFGRSGITSKKTARDKRKRINLWEIETNLNKFAKKSGDKWEVNLSDYKILGEGEVKKKLIIKAKEASQSAIEKVKKAGGEIICEEKVKKPKAKIILPDARKSKISGTTKSVDLVGKKTKVKEKDKKIEIKEKKKQK